MDDGRPTASFVPGVDIAPSSLALAWRADAETPEPRTSRDVAVETTAVQRA